jgi:hypothetical protein
MINSISNITRPNTREDKLDIISSVMELNLDKAKKLHLAKILYAICIYKHNDFPSLDNLDNFFIKKLESILINSKDPTLATKLLLLCKHNEPNNNTYFGFLYLRSTRMPRKLTLFLTCLEPSPINRTVILTRILYEESIFDTSIISF